MMGGRWWLDIQKLAISAADEDLANEHLDEDLKNDQDENFQMHRVFDFEAQKVELSPTRQRWNGHLRTALVTAALTVLAMKLTIPSGSTQEEKETQRLKAVGRKHRRSSQKQRL